ncbi:hypothetical protein GGF46_001341 [Coemansia sp. RSA 552]|nr:hypothetical protein GGF46_001341 [Coemansia sp. RSA 552]
MALQKSFLDANPMDMSWINTQMSFLQSTNNSQNETLASKINLSISDLHSDLKKLERTVMLEGSSPRTNVVDMESKIMASVAEGFSKIASEKVEGMVLQIENALSQSATDRKEFARSSTQMLEGLKEAAADIQQQARTIGTGGLVQGSLQIPPMLLPSNEWLPPAPPLPQLNLLEQPLPPLMPTGAYDIQPIAPAVPENNGSSSSAASTQCIVFGYTVPEQRTSCKTAFTSAEAMESVEAQCAAARIMRPPRQKRPRRSR